MIDVKVLFILNRLMLLVCNLVCFRVCLVVGMGVVSISMGLFFCIERWWMCVWGVRLWFFMVCLFVMSIVFDVLLICEVMVVVICLFGVSGCSLVMCLSVVLCCMFLLWLRLFSGVILFVN